MHLQRVAGMVCYVDDITETAAFYETLGFQFDTREPDHLSVQLNGFWIDFHPADKETRPEFRAEAQADPKGGGQSLYVRVADVDEFHAGLIAKGLKPSSAPLDWPWGNREFVIRDPSGYKLVFFKQK